MCFDVGLLLLLQIYKMVGSLKWLLQMFTKVFYFCISDKYHLQAALFYYETDN